MSGKKSLVCLDFDSTIPLQHLYDLILDHFYAEIKGSKSQSIEEKNASLLAWSQQNEEVIWQYLNNTSQDTSATPEPPYLQPIAINGGQQWQTTIHSLIEQEHQIAIVSFNPFTNIIKRYLKEIIGLSPDIVENHIIYDTFFPKKPSAENKNHYIQRVTNVFYQKHDKYPAEIVLVDDSKGNIAAAKMVGYQAILAEPNGRHFYRLEEKFNLSLELPPEPAPEPAPQPFLIQPRGGWPLTVLQTTSTSSTACDSAMRMVTVKAPEPQRNGYIPPTAITENIPPACATPKRITHTIAPSPTQSKYFSAVHPHPYLPPANMTSTTTAGTDTRPACSIPETAAVTTPISRRSLKTRLFAPPEVTDEGRTPGIALTQTAPAAGEKPLSPTRHR